MTLKKTVYLAGPISGLTFEGASDWRDHARQLFEPYGDVRVLSPLRGKNYLAGKGQLGNGDYSTVHPLSSDKGIVTRDRNDVMHADVVIAYFTGCRRASTGTCIELGWADAFRVPVIAVMEDDGVTENPHDTHMVRGIVGYRVRTLPDAVDIAATILGYDVTMSDARDDERWPDPVLHPVEWARRP